MTAPDDISLAQLRRIARRRSGVAPTAGLILGLVIIAVSLVVSGSVIFSGGVDFSGARVIRRVPAPGNEPSVVHRQSSSRRERVARVAGPVSDADAPRRLVIRSEPNGATVSMEGARLGVTNFVWQPKGLRTPVEFLFEREGFKPLRRHVDPLVDHDLRVRLERLPEPPAPVRDAPAMPKPGAKPHEAPATPSIYETL